MDSYAMNNNEVVNHNKAVVGQPANKKKENNSDGIHWYGSKHNLINNKSLEIFNATIFVFQLPAEGYIYEQIFSARLGEPTCLHIHTIKNCLG